MASPLSDLDELVLECRGEKAKNYIKEAVACYKSGAFRSLIVSTCTKQDRHLSTRLFCRRSAVI